jgi:NAD(P)H-dependent flavin oxidoreductase YrpB (nitropropane dioxygenase family)
MPQPSPVLDLLRRRIVVAPMAGGATTTGLVIAAARAGALGFLAAGYKTPAAMAAEVAALLADPPAITSFTFGCPAADLVRAFSGRPARGLVNQFIVEHPDAPPAYPEPTTAAQPRRART